MPLLCFLRQYKPFSGWWLPGFHCFRMACPALSQSFSIPEQGWVTLGLELGLMPFCVWVGQTPVAYSLRSLPFLVLETRF